MSSSTSPSPGADGVNASTVPGVAVADNLHIGFPPDENVPTPVTNKASAFASVFLSIVKVSVFPCKTSVLIRSRFYVIDFQTSLLSYPSPAEFLEYRAKV